MTDYSNLIQPDSGQAATEIEIISKEGFADWFSAQPGPVRAAASAQKFDGSVGDFAILHIPGSEDWKAALIVSDAAKLEHWSLAKAAEALPEGTYRLKGAETGDALLGWLLGQYRFDEYRSEPKLKGARSPTAHREAETAKAHRG